MTEDITIRKSAVMLPTAIKTTGTSETLILDFMNEEFIGEQTKYISFASIALTKSNAQSLYEVIGNFLQITNNEEEDKK